MPNLLVVHHTVSPALQTMLDATLGGAEQVPDVSVSVRPALRCTAVDVLEADGFVLGAPVNIGMIAGALKHFFDSIYYPCLDATVGRPWGLYLHGNDDAAGALRDVEKIVTGLRWKQVAAHVVVTGAVGREHRDALENLGGTVALAASGALA